MGEGQCFRRRLATVLGLLWLASSAEFYDRNDCFALCNRLASLAKQRRDGRGFLPSIAMLSNELFGGSGPKRSLIRSMALLGDDDEPPELDLEQEWDHGR